MVYFGPNFLLQLVNGGIGVRILCIIVQPAKPTFLLDEIWDGFTNWRFWVIAAAHILGVDVSTALMSLSLKGTGSSSSSSWVVMLVSTLVRLFLVCCVASHCLCCQIGSVVQQVVFECVCVVFMCSQWIEIFKGRF